MKYKVSWSKDGSIGNKQDSGEPPFVCLDGAIQLARTKVSENASVTVLRDSDGEDHPDNAGKYFLHLIIK